MTRSTSSPALHTDAQIVAVAEGLALVAGTAATADQLRRIYGERRATEALLTLAGTTAPRPAIARPAVTQSPATQVTAGPARRPTHPWERVAEARTYGPAPRTSALKVYWL